MQNTTQRKDVKNSKLLTQFYSNYYVYYIKTMQYLILRSKLYSTAFVEKRHKLEGK